MWVIERADDVCNVFIARIAGHQFIKAEEGKRGDHRLATPAGLHLLAIEALDEEHVLAFGRAS